MLFKHRCLAIVHLFQTLNTRPMQKLNALLALLCFVFTSTISAQSPAVLNSTIPYDSNPSLFGNQAGYFNVADIEAAYNLARRREELQFCIPTNSISDLDLPNQNVWNAMNSDEKILYLLNAERVSRAGLNYCNGEGAVSGLAFTGVEANIDNIAQAHAEQLIATQSTQVISQAANIDANGNIGGSGCTGEQGQIPNCCHTFVNFSAYRIFFTNMETPSNPNTITTPGIEVRTVFFLVYGNGSLGNGRRMALLQDLELGGSVSSSKGFFDDYGDTGDEGFIGIGMHGGIPHPSLNRNHIDMVIFSYFDPIPQSYGCSYTCTSCGPCAVNSTLNSNSIQSGTYQASNSINSSGRILDTNDVSMQAGGFVSLNATFEVRSGATFQAFINGCYFSL